MRYLKRPVLAAATALWLCTSAVGQVCTTPLPSDVVKASPGDSGRGAFLGVWGNGMWDGKLCHTLAVESLSGEGAAIVVYSYGAYPAWNIKAPGFYRLEGKFEGDTLHLDFPSIRARAEYKLANGSLQGQYFSASGPVAIVLTRKP